ncbi:hypothetical protein T492DRAFT_875934, partial [Pavlovales sp. CCMP2436]
SPARGGGGGVRGASLRGASSPIMSVSAAAAASAEKGAEKVEKGNDDAIEQQATDACAGASEDSNASRAPSATDMVSAVMPAMQLGAIKPARTPARHSPAE